MDIPARRVTWLVVSLAVLAACAAAAPFVLRGGPGPERHVSIRGEEVLTYGFGPYKDMPAEIAVQGLAQDAITLAAVPASRFVATNGGRTSARRYVGSFLLVNGTLIALLWLSVVVPPLLAGTLYPMGLHHFTTMVVQGFDLALFLPPSLIAGYSYLRGRALGALLAPSYCVFLSLQMLALLAKILWMNAVGASAGPALVLIPLLLLGALVATGLSIAPHHGASIETGEDLGHDARTPA